MVAKMLCFLIGIYKLNEILASQQNDENVQLKRSANEIEDFWNFHLVQKHRDYQ